MTREEKTERTVQELFHTHAANGVGPDGGFMQILQGFIFGDVCSTGSLNSQMRELVTVTVLTTLSALPQLKAHVQASLNAGCTPVQLREAVYQCAPFIGFPRTLNAIGAMNEVFSANGIPLPLPEEKAEASREARFQRGAALQAPLFSEYAKSQPFSPNYLRPCPLLDNKGALAKMVHDSDADSTDLSAKEDVDDLCAKCADAADNWKPVADSIWQKTHPGAPL